MCASSFVFARTGFIGMCSGLARPRPSPRCRPTNRHVGCCDVTKDIAIFGDRSDLPSYIALLQHMVNVCSRICRPSQLARLGSMANQDPRVIA